MGTNMLPSLARRLIAEGLLDETKAQMAAKQAENSDIPLISYLVNSQIIDGYTIAKMNSELFGLPLFDISAINFETIPHNCISEKTDDTVPLLSSVQARQEAICGHV